MTGPQQRRNPGRSGIFVPRVETLEERWVPAVHFTAFNATLTIKGVGQTGRIVINDNGTSGVNNVVASVKHSTFLPGIAINRVTVKTKTGNDRVTYNLLAPMLPNVTRTVVVSLGEGVNQFSAHLKNGLSTGSSLLLEVKGGLSPDLLTVDAGGSFGIGSRAALTVDLMGGGGADVLAMNYRGQNLGTLAIFAAGGEGADTIGTGVFLETGNTGNVSAQELGGDANDNLTLSVQKFSLFDGGAVSATIDGGLGVNTCTASPNVTSVRCAIKKPV